jgi:hypothetical protein
LPEDIMVFPVAKKRIDDQSIMDDDASDDSNLTKTLTCHEVDNPEAEQPLAHRETIAVKRSKILVILALVVSAAVVATFAYLITAEEEESNFEGDVSWEQCMPQCSRPPFAVRLT